MVKINGNEINTNQINQYIKVSKMAQGNSSYNVFYKRMSLYAKSLYNIEGLPATCDLETLVNDMYYSGQACFFDTSFLGNFNGIINTGIGGGGRMDIYGHYNTYNLTTRNGRTFTSIPKTRIVLMQNNIDSMPLDEFIQYYALKMWTIEQTIDNNLYKLRNSMVWECDEDSVNTMRNLFNKFDNFEPIILGKKKATMIETKNLMSDTKYYGKELSELKTNVWGEFLTFLGINNVETQKRAELKEAEVNKNNQLVRYSNNVFMQWWQKALDQANIKWGLGMKLVANAQVIEELQKEVDNVNLYDNNAPSL